MTTSTFSLRRGLKILGAAFDNGRKIRYERIPEWVQGEELLMTFLPYVCIIGDSREQNKWVEKACEYYGIGFRWVSASDEGCLKEGDYTFEYTAGDVRLDYTGKVAYERKGSCNELWNNLTADRERICREFNRFRDKKYDKVVLLLEFGEKLTDLIDMRFSFRAHDGRIVEKNTRNVLYSALQSWRQPNSKNFTIIQSNTHESLFWQWIEDIYYYFRNDVNNRAKEIDNGNQGTAQGAQSGQ